MAGSAKANRREWNRMLRGEVAMADQAVAAGGAQNTVPAGRVLNAQLSPEAQHVVNSLEAHFNAVKAAVAEGTPELIEQAKDLGGEVLDALERWGIQFANHAAAVAHVGSEAPANTLKGAATGGGAGTVGSAESGMLSGGNGPEGEPGKSA